MITFRVNKAGIIQYAIVSDTDNVGTWTDLSTVSAEYQLKYFLWRQGANIPKPTE